MKPAHGNMGFRLSAKAILQGVLRLHRDSSLKIGRNTAKMYVPRVYHETSHPAQALHVRLI